jgi:hypothetical protein
MKELVDAVEFSTVTDVAAFKHVHTKIHGMFSTNSVQKDEIEDLMAVRGRSIYHQKKKMPQWYLYLFMTLSFNIYLFI